MGRMVHVLLTVVILIFTCQHSTTYEPVKAPFTPDERAQFDQIVAAMRAKDFEGAAKLLGQVSDIMDSYIDMREFRHSRGGRSFQFIYKDEFLFVRVSGTNQVSAHWNNTYNGTGLYLFINNLTSTNATVGERWGISLVEYKDGVPYGEGKRWRFVNGVLVDTPPLESQGLLETWESASALPNIHRFY